MCVEVLGQFGGGDSLSQKRSGGKSRRKEKMKEGLAGERETQRCAIRSARGGEETVEKYGDAVRTGELELGHGN